MIQSPAQIEGRAERGWCEPRRSPGRDLSRPTLGPWYDRVARLFGWRLWDWQRHVFDVALEVAKGPGGIEVPAHRRIGCIAGRQSGKSALLLTLVAGKLFSGHNVIVTAQERANARLMWFGHVQIFLHMFGGRKVFESVGGRLDMSKGEEQLTMPNGAWYRPFTPNRKSARGKTVDVVIIDEAAYVGLEVLESVMGTMAARPRFQLWLLSTAGDWRSEMLAGYRDSEEVCMLEWGAEEGDDISDPAVHARALPTLDEIGAPDGTGWGVTSEFLRSELAADPVVFAREYLSIWTQDPLGSLLSPALWAELAGDASTVARGPSMRIGIDVSPDRAYTSICAAAPQPDGAVHVEVLDHRAEGGGWAVRRMRQIRDRIGGGQANVVVIDGRSAARPYIPALKRAGFRVVELGAADYAAHCGVLCDLAHLRRIRHRPHEAMDAAVASAGRRKLSEAWAWDRFGEDPITALCAVSLAVGEVYRRQHPVSAAA